MLSVDFVKDPNHKILDILTLNSKIKINLTFTLSMNVKNVS